LAVLHPTLQVHYKRANPVHLVYRRPHVSLDNLGRVNGLFWAPPFEVNRASVAPLPPSTPPTPYPPTLQPPVPSMGLELACPASWRVVCCGSAAPSASCALGELRGACFGMPEL
jgi:hypothetical protein